ncbi:hypothetical protein SBC1_08750 [Caballeronia sp. SBC1]|uniref:hypothetical protein n=1 Tax=Caballeronia sp. SBC1 TaxID=2705548 RepID=UPI00140D0977|nr:hypothetical protein [Caballeronia sp. SBC1]QIN60896.1 hypothetical protein SBC1_08750 [Caballeronia sp. SBC1]
MTDTTRTAIEAAFRKLELLPGVESQISTMTDMLVPLYGGDRHPFPAHLRVKDRKTANLEIDKISSVANKLALLLDDLSEPSIDALADSGLLQIIHHDQLSAILKQVATIARKADLSKAAKTGDRGPANHLAKGIASILAHGFETLTGNVPTLVTPADTRQKKYSPFITLVGDVFSALNIDAKPEGYAKAAKESYRPKAEK